MSEVQGVVEEAGGNLKHLSAMEEVTYFYFYEIRQSMFQFETIINRAEHIYDNVLYSIYCIHTYMYIYIYI